jgi:hypothetical protein
LSQLNLNIKIAWVISLLKIPKKKIETRNMNFLLADCESALSMFNTPLPSEHTPREKHVTTLTHVEAGEEEKKKSVSKLSKKRKRGRPAG